MELQDYFQGGPDAEQADFMRRKRLERQQPQVQQPSVVGNNVMKPQSLYESIMAQAEGTGDQISAKTKEAKERAKALLRVIRGAR